MKTHLEMMMKYRHRFIKDLWG